MSVRRGAMSCVVGAIVLGYCVGGCSGPEDQLESRDSAKRIEAIRQLSREGGSAAAEAVGKAVTDRDIETAQEACRALGRMSDVRTVEGLTRAVKEDDRSAVRYEAAVHLAMKRTPESAEALRRIVRADPDARVRAAAAASLGKLGRFQDVELLVQTAETDDDVAVQCAAVRAVERIVRLEFLYDPTAPAEERRQALARVRSRALRTAAIMDRIQKSSEVSP